MKKNPQPEEQSNTPAPYSSDGVDRTLIRWMLSLSPAQRLEAAQNAARSIIRLRDARSDS